MLKSKNNIVRYWAIFGLRSQKKEILEPYKKEIFNANYDSYPPISVTALAIFYQFFTDPEAENKLKEFCKNSNMDITLIAINYLLYSKNKAPFIETIKAVHEMPDNNYNVKAPCVDFLGVLGIVENTVKKDS